MTTQGLLGIYLNDHLAGAITGTGLARRMAASAEPGTHGRARHPGPRLQGLRLLGWERAGRLKLNGRLVARSPLSDLEETEMLRLGVDGKAAGWRTLRALAERDGRLDAERLAVIR